MFFRIAHCQGYLHSVHFMLDELDMSGCRQLTIRGRPIREWRLQADQLLVSFEANEYLWEIQDLDAINRVS